MSDLVLVTGLSGFIGSHVAAQLLAKGYRVRGTVRNKAKGQKTVDALAARGADVSKLELVEANLSADSGWEAAVQDCRYIQHIASPFPMEAPNHREALVPEARAGAMRVIEHGLGAGAERIVMTSSIVAMIGQKGRGPKMRFTEQDWSDPDWKPLRAYAVSKTRAELSAWAYIEKQTQTDRSRLTVVNPGLVLGPDSYGNAGTSLGIIKALLGGEFPKTPKVAYPIIDVRDCAAIHAAAMTSKAAGGRRLIAAGQTLWMNDIAKVLRSAYPEAKLPNGDVPNFIVKLGSFFDDRVKGIVPDLGTYHEADNGYVSTMTQVIPRPAKEAILAAAESMIASGAIELG